MHSLVHSEIFDLALVVGTYIAATILYKKTHLSVLHPFWMLNMLRSSKAVI